MAFAKLYETTKRGQILVLRDYGDEGPELRVFVQPPDLGVCNFAIKFKDTDEGERLADDAFERMNEDTALSLADKVFGELGGKLGLSA